MKTITSIETSEAKRIAKRLLNHWKHKFEVTEQDQISVIYMPESEIKLISKDASLDIEIETTRTDVETLQKVVLDHVNRMAQQEFEAEWHAS